MGDGASSHDEDSVLRGRLTTVYTAPVSYGWSREVPAKRQTSLRKTAVIMKLKAENAEAAAQGRKYGNLIQNGCENSRGHLL